MLILAILACAAPGQLDSGQAAPWVELELDAVEPGDCGRLALSGTIRSQGFPDHAPRVLVLRAEIEGELTTLSTHSLPEDGPFESVLTDVEAEAEGTLEALLYASIQGQHSESLPLQLDPSAPPVAPRVDLGQPSLPLTDQVDLVLEAWVSEPWPDSSHQQPVTWSLDGEVQGSFLPIEASAGSGAVAGALLDLGPLPPGEHTVVLDYDGECARSAEAELLLQVEACPETGPCPEPEEEAELQADLVLVEEGGNHSREEAMELGPVEPFTWVRLDADLQAEEGADWFALHTSDVALWNDQVLLRLDGMGEATDLDLEVWTGQGELLAGDHRAGPIPEEVAIDTDDSLLVDTPLLYLRVDRFAGEAGAYELWVRHIY